MKRVFTHIGFSMAVTLLIINLIGVKYTLVVLAGLVIIFIAGLALPKYREALTVPVCVGSAIFSCLIFMCVFNSTVVPQQQLDHKNAEISFYVVDSPEINDEGEYVYTVKTTQITLDGAPQNIKLLLKSDNPIEYESYQILKAKATFYKIGDSAFSSYGYWGNNIFLSSKIDFCFLTDDYVKSPWRYTLNLRRDIFNVFSSYIGGDEGAISSGLITGSKIYLSQELYSAFKYAGLSHIITVSGIHLTIIVAALLSLFRLLRVNDKIAYLIAIFFVLAEIGVAGFSKSVIRAGIMAIIIMLSKLINRHADGLNSLGLAVFLICLNPFAVYDVGAMLSTTATLALLVLKPVFDRPFAPVARKIMSGFIIATSVMIFTLPIMYLFFGYVSIAGIISNAVITPFCSVAIILSLLTYISVKIRFFAVPMISLCRAFNSAIISGVKYFASFENSVVSFSNEFGFVIAFALIMFGICFMLNNKRLLKPTAVGCMIIIFASIVVMSFGNAGNARALICKNGAIAICHDGKTVVYGVDEKADYYSVRSFLFSNNAKIDAIIIDDSIDYTLKLADDFGADTIVAPSFSTDLLEQGKYNNLNICTQYNSAFSDGFIVNCYKDNEMNYCSLTVNGVNILIGNNIISKADILINNDIAADSHGTIDLQNGDIVYTVYNNGDYSARRLNIWQK